MSEHRTKRVDRLWVLFRASAFIVAIATVVNTLVHVAVSSSRGHSWLIGELINLAVLVALACILAISERDINAIDPIKKN